MMYNVKRIKHMLKKMLLNRLIFIGWIKLKPKSYIVLYA